MAIRTLSHSDLEAILSGAALLGSGGGGPVWLGKQLIGQLPANSVKLIDVTDIADDATLAITSFVGAPQALQGQNIDYGAVSTLAFNALAQLKNTKFSYIAPLETGAGNSFIPMAVAAKSGIPLIDGDGARRAFVSLMACTWAAFPASPLVILRSQAEQVSLDASNIGLVTSALMGVLSSSPDLALGSALALWPLTGAQAKQAAVKGAVSYALNLGHAIHAAQSAHTDPVAAAVHFTGGELLFVGKVVSLNIPQSFSLGTAVFTDGKTTFTVLSESENMLAWNSNSAAPVAIAPDGIGYMTPAGATMSVTELTALPAGQEVAILRLPAAAPLTQPPISNVYAGLLASMGYAGAQPLPSSHN